MASPFVDKTFTFTQPDGTRFEVRGSDDQHYAAFETLDGYAVVRNPSTGFFEIAQVSSDETMLEPAPGPQGNLDGKRAAVRPGFAELCDGDDQDLCKEGLWVCDGEGLVCDDDPASVVEGCDDNVDDDPNYFPEDMGRQRFYAPVERGFERELKKRIEYFERLRRERNG